MDADGELAEYLRARRERVTPADVGLPDSGRRRTPGLRREEVATLAGVSVDYLVRLEQGRDTNPSPSILGALATALRLSDVEKRHLFFLATKRSSSGLCPTAVSPSDEVPATVQVLLDRLEPTPAFVLAPTADVLAWTGAWEQLVTPLGLLDELAAGNLARFVFLHPGSRHAYLDWEAVADDQVSRLRTASDRWGHDDRFAQLLAELQLGSDFAERWSRHELAEKGRGEIGLSHPDLGDLRIAFETLSLADDAEQQLVTWLPADGRTEAAFDTLGTAAPTSPAQLRVVGEG